MRINKFLITLLLCIAIQSCQQDNFYFEEVAKIEGTWNAKDSKSFGFPVKKDNNTFNLFFILRNNNDYEYSNIYLFTELKSPDGKVIIDTLEYQLAYPDGIWTGFGMGEIKQNTLVYKENIALQDTGRYQVRVTQAMREEKLIGIEDISLMIEKN